jgi:FkbM family methyltransferase
MKKYLKSLIRKTGFQVVRIQPVTVVDPTSGDGMFNGLARLRSIGLDPSTIIDVGAAEGIWTEKAAKVWKEADFLLFEPLEERKEVLAGLHSRLANKVFITFAAAGNEESAIDFYVSEDLDGSGIATDELPSNAKRTVRLTSIDLQVSSSRLPPPYGIKLDTHGFEVPILAGARETLKDTLFIVIECYGFNIAPGSLLFWQMCEHMEQYGFRLFDIVDVMRRPADKAFWQCDAFFIKRDNALFEKKSYR